MPWEQRDGNWNSLGAEVYFPLSFWVCVVCRWWPFYVDFVGYNRHRTNRAWGCYHYHITCSSLIKIEDQNSRNTETREYKEKNGKVRWSWSFHKGVKLYPLIALIPVSRNGSYPRGTVMTARFVDSIIQLDVNVDLGRFAPRHRYRCHEEIYQYR